jgi:group I intron endonuclease
MIRTILLSLLISNTVELRRDISILLYRIAVLILLFVLNYDIFSLAVVTIGLVLLGGLLLNTKRIVYFINKAYLATIQQRKSRTTFVYMKNSKRAYSTLVKKGQFWSKVNSHNISDQDNPFILVNSFLKKYPTQELARPNINLDLICSILTRHIPNFELSPKVFNLLKKISPVRLELPLQMSNLLTEHVGNYVRNGEIGKGGVYVFTNKLNGFSYVGSSIYLANRLTTGYLGPNLGNRVVDLAIKDVGLENFYLDLYIIPQELLDLALTEVKSRDSYVEEFQETSLRSTEKSVLKNFSLALEQMFILEFNPEYNVLKVAASPAGLKRSPGSMLPSLIKNYRATYMYDSKTNKLLFIANSRSGLVKSIGLDLRNLSRILKENKLYLDRFILSSVSLNESDFTIETMSPEELINYVDEIRKDWKKVLSVNISKIRKAAHEKLSKKVELTNMETGEGLVLNSLNETARYLQALDPKYSKYQPGTLSSNIKNGSLYKGVFKIKYVEKEE